MMDDNAKDCLKYMFSIGLKPVGYSVVLLEDTWVFETDEEAHSAFKMLEGKELEDGTLICGWWYGKKEFIEMMPTYMKERNQTEHEVIWFVESKFVSENMTMNLQ
jgi:hypothetical protein